MLSLQYDKRLMEKKKQMKGEIDILKPAAAPPAAAAPPEPPASLDTGPAAKGQAVQQPCGSNSTSQKAMPVAPPSSGAATGKRAEGLPEEEEKAGGFKKGKLA